MMLASLVFDAPRWLFPAAVIALAAAWLLWRGYRSSGGSARLRASAGTLKLAVLVALACFLAEPLWSGLRARPGANLFLVLADDSRSLQIVPGAGDNSPSRGEALQALFGEERAAWRTRLAQDFDVRAYLFGTRLEGLPGFNLESGVRSPESGETDPTSLARAPNSGLQTPDSFQQHATSLAETLEALRDRYRGRPVAGVLLFTDGNATDLDRDRSPSAGGAFETAGHQPVDTGLPPIFPVLVGEPLARPDIAIGHVAVSRTAFEDAPVTLRADVTVRGEGTGDLLARVTDEEGNVVAEQSQPRTTGRPISFRFELRPKTKKTKADAGPNTEAAGDRANVSFYRVRVFAGDRATTDEATPLNNERLVAVDHGRGRQRVLYLGGRPNWEFKFLRRAIAEDDWIDLVGLIRIARQEPKFDWRGRRGESSNPLFRGFDRAADDAERYDEPVLVRLDTLDADELQSGFPDMAADLFRYDALVLDDVEAAFFTPAQRRLVHRFVAERGGGLLMLGGVDTFRAGGYRETPIGEMLPVYLDRTAHRIDEPAATEHAAQASVGGTEFRLAFTRDGWLQPWVRLRRDEDAERARIAEMPSFRILNRFGAVKPGAIVLAEAVDPAGKHHPALIAQRFGRGRCAAVALGDLWRWPLKRDPAAQADQPSVGVPDDSAKAWRQMLRWLVADVPGRASLEISRAERSGTDGTWVRGMLRLRVRTRDADYHPLDQASVRITVRPPEGEPIVLDAEPSLDEPGLHEARFRPRLPGAYRFLAQATDGEGSAVGTAEAGWVHDPDADEFASVDLDRERMQWLARQTGGEVIAPDDLERFVAGLPTREVPVVERRAFPLWHQAWVFVVIVGGLVGEWGLRRWKGLP